MIDTGYLCDNNLDGISNLCDGWHNHVDTNLEQLDPQSTLLIYRSWTEVTTTLNIDDNNWTPIQLNQQNPPGSFLSTWKLLDHKSLTKQIVDEGRTPSLSTLTWWFTNTFDQSPASDDPTDADHGTLWIGDLFLPSTVWTTCDDGKTTCYQHGNWIPSTKNHELVIHSLWKQSLLDVV